MTVKIDAKMILHSISNRDKELISIETWAPYFLDAECLTGNTKLHFERKTGKTNKKGKNSWCLSEMSVADFYNKWVNGINKTGSKGTTFQSEYKHVLKGMRLRSANLNTMKSTQTSIVDIWQTGIKKVYKIKTLSGIEITASANHLFYGINGWIRLEDISPTDLIAVRNHKGNYSKSSFTSKIRKNKKGHSKKINFSDRNINAGYLSYNRQIRKQKLEDQQFRCHRCQTDINETDNIHHIKPVSSFPKLKFDYNNTVALCKKCHNKEHIKLSRSSTKPSFHEVHSIEYMGEEMCYDIQVSAKNHAFVANGFIVHNCEKHGMLSSNSSSNRAIPFTRMIEREAYIPPDVRYNQPGMQGDNKVSERDYEIFSDMVKDIYNYTGKKMLSNRDKKYHKQHLNRYLTGFSMQRKIITGTRDAWDGFFELRIHKDADPNIYILAELIKKEIELSTNPNLLQEDEWHAPYILNYEVFKNTEEMLKVSAARCARTSYDSLKTGKLSTLDEDLNIFNNKLMTKPLHATPLTHQGTPLPMATGLPPSYWPRGATLVDKNNEYGSGNFRGFGQFRHWYKHY